MEAIATRAPWQTESKPNAVFARTACSCSKVGASLKKSVLDRQKVKETTAVFAKPRLPPHHLLQLQPQLLQIPLPPRSLNSSQIRSAEGRPPMKAALVSAMPTATPANGTVLIIWLASARSARTQRSSFQTAPVKTNLFVTPSLSAAATLDGCARQKQLQQPPPLRPQPQRLQPHS